VESLSNLQLVDSTLELGDCASNDNNVSAFAGKLKSSSSAHAIRATGDENSLKDKISCSAI
jgi:hypothetical protein